MRAETEASSLANWTELHRSFKSYAQCDDAAIGEGYSDTVARLLTKDWSSFDQLNRLAAHDKTFEKFVLHHVDELMSPTQAQTIRENAEVHCPVNARQLCKAILTRIKQSSGAPN
jgi:hypothetical protein